VKTRALKHQTGRRDAKPSRRPVSASGLITLLTDFGTADYFVAAVKGVILASNPHARIVDITHEIAPHDIEAGAFTLLAACSSFPPSTVHVAVVDPGVGSSRRPIVTQANEQFFVGPDNGIFSYVCDRAPQTETVHLTNTKYFRHPVSPTFNGRDIFAPVAAALSTGVEPSVLGETIEDHVKLKPLKAETAPGGEILGRIIQVDRFGNCVTNITPDELTPEMIGAGAKVRVKRKTVKSFRSYFAEDTGSRDKVFAIWGSAGFLEIAAVQESAAKVLNLRRGDEVTISGAYERSTRRQEQ
jgi:S-adenosyl-L-methionine hydrolase (adenosine-forming)